MYYNIGMFKAVFPNTSDDQQVIQTLILIEKIYCVHSTARVILGQVLSIYTQERCKDTQPYKFGVLQKIYHLFVDWYECATDEDCATQCVRNYLDRYGTYCTGRSPSFISCEEFGGIHNGGPLGCDSSATAGYRQKVAECCTQTRC